MTDIVCICVYGRYVLFLLLKSNGSPKSRFGCLVQVWSKSAIVLIKDQMILSYDCI